MSNPYPPEYDDDPLCDICEKPVSVCQCPECPVCGWAGRKECIEEHGLKIK